MSYVVTGPLVITKKQDGSDLYLYQGSQIPDHVSDKECKRLANLGLAEKVDGRKSSSAETPAENN